MYLVIVTMWFYYRLLEFTDDFKLFTVLIRLELILTIIIKNKNNKDNNVNLSEFTPDSTQPCHKNSLNSIMKTT